MANLATIYKNNLADWFFGDPRPIGLNVGAPDWFFGDPRPIRLNVGASDWFFGHPRPIRLNVGAADWFFGRPRPIRLNVGASVDQIHDAVLTGRAQASVRKVRRSRATSPWSLQLASGRQYHFAGVGDDLARRLQRVIGADPDAALS
jgi:hypothetical protein